MIFIFAKCANPASYWPTAVGLSVFFISVAFVWVGFLKYRR